LIYRLTETSFLLAGRKYQDTTVRTSSNTGPKYSAAPSLMARWENTAPDMAKKKPA